MRGIVFDAEAHTLTNFGVFFQDGDLPVPVGLRYVYKPTDLQCFAVCFTIKIKDPKFTRNVTVLVPGPEAQDWALISKYQRLIDSQESIDFPFIKLPEEFQLDRETYPYTTTWNERSHFKIWGEI
jgi:hypothetical protein